MDFLSDLQSRDLSQSDLHKKGFVELFFQGFKSYKTISKEF